MHKSFGQYELIGLGYVIVVGVASHYVYELFSPNLLLNTFFPINESVWEHLKLLFYPFFTYSIIEYFLTNNTYKQLMRFKLISVIVGMATTIIIFYTYSGIIGNHYAVIDILIFFISVIVSFVCSYILITNFDSPRQTTIISVCGFVVLIIIFAFFAYYPPQIPLFENPQRLSLLSIFTLFHE